MSTMQRTVVRTSFFFFSSRRRHTRSLCDWSSDVCSSDLLVLAVLSTMRTLTPSLASQSASTRPVGPAPIIRTSVCAICYTPLQLSRRPQQRATHRGNAMRNRAWSRRDVLKTSTALAAGVLFAEPARAAAPPPTGVTPALVEAARKEGKLSYYCALELNVGERLARTFEAKYPGIAVRVERSGAERIFQRIAQEQGSGINAVDVANSTDPAHYLDWKTRDW